MNFSLRSEVSSGKYIYVSRCDLSAVMYTTYVDIIRVDIFSKPSSIPKFQFFKNYISWYFSYKERVTYSN